MPDSTPLSGLREALDRSDDPFDWHCRFAPDVHAFTREYLHLRIGETLIADGICVSEGASRFLRGSLAVLNARARPGDGRIVELAESYLGYTREAGRTPDMPRDEERRPVRSGGGSGIILTVVEVAAEE